MGLNQVASDCAATWVELPHCSESRGALQDALLLEPYDAGGARGAPGTIGVRAMDYQDRYQQWLASSVINEESKAELRALEQSGQSAELPLEKKLLR